MAKELPYFRFTAQEWQNGNISLESYELKGLFIDVCAYYWARDCSITKVMLEKKFSDAKALLEILFNLDIIAEENGDGFVQISFLDNQFDLLSERRLRRQKAGSMGGKQKSSNAKAKLKQCSSYKDKDNDKEKDKNKIKRGVFVNPTKSEIQEHCKENGYNVNAETFFNHYESNGWKIGKNKMVSWKSALSNWNTRNKQSPNLGSKRLSVQLTEEEKELYR